jgi:predicted acyl esterase
MWSFATGAPLPMRQRTGGTALVHPSRRPGAIRYGLHRVWGMVKPPVTVYPADPAALVKDLDVGITVRDGVTLRVNVYRPLGDGPFPVLLCAHPYGKDKLPVKRRRGYRVSFQYRALRQTAPIRFSDLTSWEAPDPVWWVEQGFAVINADLRGAGTSDGVGATLSNTEGEDVHDLIEWAGVQPWSTGRVGMLGVSYLAISQYKAAALRPPHLQAICPWEGFTDAYRDLMRPGGLCEDGFLRMWSQGLKATRTSVDVIAEQRRRPLRDAWWESLVPELAAIEVPMLVCASFSDNNLHTRGSFRAFEAVGSGEKFAYTHRGGKWATFYSDPAKKVQLAFFDHFLRDGPDPELDRVRLEVRDSCDHVVAVRGEAEWPLARTRWTPLFLSPHGLTAEQPGVSGGISFDVRRQAAAFSWTIPEDTELSGPMALRLWVSIEGADDLNLVVGVEKWRAGRLVAFEGSYGYGRDRVTTGWQKASLRRLDTHASRPYAPMHTFDTPQLLRGNEVVEVQVALGPSSTAFRQGDQLRLVVGGRWLGSINPFTGQFPAHFRGEDGGQCRLAWGPERPASLLVPVVP